MTNIDEFSKRLIPEWLIPFCSARGYSDQGFDARGLLNLSESDARDFMQSIDHELVIHRDGFFTAAQSKAKEQIFWQGAKKSVPRTVTLWLEPIITIGAVRRLQRDFQWPKHLLGLQSETWAFDLVAYDPANLNTECLLCEVKKTAREIDSLISYMKKHLDSSLDIEPKLKGIERNAFKKVLALRTSKCDVFWALGPNGYEYVFRILRGPDSSVRLIPSDTSVLQAQNWSFNGRSRMASRLAVANEAPLWIKR